MVLRHLHVPVEEVEELVLEEVVVEDVPLPPRVVVRLVVPDPGEVQPLGVAPLVAWDTNHKSVAECASDVRNRERGTQGSP